MGNFTSFAIGAARQLLEQQRRKQAWVNRVRAWNVRRILKTQFGQFSPYVRRWRRNPVTRPQVIKLAFKLAIDKIKKDTTGAYTGKSMQNIVREFIPEATEMLTGQATK